MLERVFVSSIWYHNTPHVLDSTHSFLFATNESYSINKDSVGIEVSSHVQLRLEHDIIRQIHKFAIPYFDNTDMLLVQTTLILEPE